MVNEESPLPNNNKNNNMSYHSIFMFVLDKKIRNLDTFASLIYSVEKSLFCFFFQSTETLPCLQYHTASGEQLSGGLEMRL